MRRELLVPKLGLTMTECTFIEWVVASGQPFKAEEIIFIIESEKAATKVLAEADGVLLETKAEPDAVLPVGAVIGYWDDGASGEGVPALAESAPQKAAAPALVTVSAPPHTPSNVQTPADAPKRIPATPLARRIAKQRGIDLARVSGSGPHGRIRMRDLPDMPMTRETPPVGSDAALTAGGTLCRPSSTDQTIARRITAAKQDIPHFYLLVEAELSELLALRADLNGAQNDIRLTLNHFIVAAVGRALAETPDVNRVWTDEGILSFDASDVGMAVNTGRGLFVPVLRNVGRQTVSAVARAANLAIERAQAGRLGPAEMTGGTITVSNAGMHDVTYMTSIINPGQAMILGVGSIREVFRPDTEGRPEIKREIGMVLSADHRVLDGVSALGFLKRIVSHLERPLALLL